MTAWTTAVLCIAVPLGLAATIVVVTRARRAVRNWWRNAGVLLDALIEPPAPGETAAGFLPPPAAGPQPRVPGLPQRTPKPPGRHAHGGVLDDTRRYENGCWHMYDGRGRLIASNCPDAHRLARIETELKDTP